jgi:two-component system, cell cycle sensor histidine kinase and response regulator CckA
VILPGHDRQLIGRFAEPLNNRQSLMFNDSADGMLIIDQMYRIVQVNPRLLSMLGRPLDDWSLVRSLFTPTEWPCIRVALAAGPWDELAIAPVQACLVDGSKVTVVVSVSPVREIDGSLRGFIIRLTDINVERRLEPGLVNSQKLNVVGQLAVRIAHDFSNLLTAITTATDSILTRAEVDLETMDDLRQVRLAADRGAALVRQLLPFGHDQPLQSRVIAVNAALSGMVGLLRRLLGGKVRLDLAPEQSEHMICIDPIQLDRVLINLAVNARNAMPAGGTLSLRSSHRTLCRPETHGPGTISPGRYVLIEVEDTGVGISPEVMPKIFEPFFTTRRDTGGNGFGLSTVLEIIRQSGGFLTISSGVNQGTTVRLYLRRYEGNLPTEPLSAPVAFAEPLASPEHLLLVEDDTAVRRFAERGLRYAGWQVTAVDSAESAMEAVRIVGHKLDLLVPSVIDTAVDLRIAERAMTEMLRDRETDCREEIRGDAQR